MPTQSPSALTRDEQYQQLLELKEKIKQLNSVVQEGQFAEEFQRDSPFWPILSRLLSSLKDSYNADAHKAARDTRAEISNFLGREEAIKDLQYLISEFTVKADNAESERKVCEDQIAELTQILASPEGDSVDVGGAMG